VAPLTVPMNFVPPAVIKVKVEPLSEAVTFHAAATNVSVSLVPTG
jgi:hypothetical protein